MNVGVGVRAGVGVSGGIVGVPVGITGVLAIGVEVFTGTTDVEVAMLADIGGFGASRVTI